MPVQVQSPPRIKVCVAYTSMVEGTTHNGLVVGSSPTKLRTVLLFLRVLEKDRRWANAYEDLKLCFFKVGVVVF